MRNLFILILFIFIQINSNAQENKYIEGFIYDQNKESIRGVLIKNLDDNYSSISNSEGYFKLRYDNKNTFIISTKHINFHDRNITIKPKEKTHIDITLIGKNQELGEVKVKGKNSRDNIIIINNNHLKHLPVSSNSGVEQLIKTLPGVSSNNELSSQYSVRAGNFDENLIYINDIEIYRPNLINSGQQEGLSLINPLMVSSISFSPGGFGAKYGDKLSSVLDVKYKTPTKFEAEVSASLLGISSLLSNTSKNKKLNYMFGFRLKSNSYLLNSLDTKGSYRPYYIDLQGLINYQINSSLSLSLWLNHNKNQYEFMPTTRETSFGTLNQATKLKIYFEGKEKDIHKYNTEAISLKYHPNSNTFIKLMGNKYTARENENYDILGEYYLQEMLESQGQGNDLGNLGIGRYLNHARNSLEQDIYTLKAKGSHNINNIFLEWGQSFRRTEIKDNINEWQYRDSAGFSIPKSPYAVELSNNKNSRNIINFTTYSSYLQSLFTHETKLGELQAQIGLRYTYWSYKSKHIISPRLNISIIPKANKNLKINISVGSYNQTPNYREMLDIKGHISKEIKIQKAIHYAISQEYYFELWNRPFKLFSEVYYKDLKNITPYDIENVKIRYYGDKRAKGYTYGFDVRLNGEFVKSIESWISLSLLKSREKIVGGDRYTPRPNDQVINFSMFFQDYLPNNPSYTMQLSLHYASGLPTHAPNDNEINTESFVFRMPSYRRVDLGLSKDLLYNKKRKIIKSLSIGLEIFNLFDINNTISYLWIKDISNTQYAIPNYLTSRKINITLNASF